MFENNKQPSNPENLDKEKSRFNQLFTQPLIRVATSSNLNGLKRVLGLLKKAPEMEELINDEYITEDPVEQVIVAAEEVKVDTKDDLVQKDPDSKNIVPEVVDPPEQDKPVEELISESLLEKIQEKGDQLLNRDLINQEQLNRLIMVTENVIDKSDQNINLLLGDLPIPLVREVRLIEKLQLSLQKNHFMNGMISTVDENTGKFSKNMIPALFSMEDEFPLLESSGSYVDDQDLELALDEKNSIDSYMLAAYNNPDLATQYLSSYLNGEASEMDISMIYEMLPLLAEGEKFSTSLPNEFVMFYSMLQDSNISISMYETIVQTLSVEKILPPFSEKISGNLNTLLDDEVLMNELSKTDSLYSHYIPRILLDISQIDVLKEKLNKSTLSFISAMRTHTEDKFDNGQLLDGIKETNDVLETPIKSEKLSKEFIIARLEAIYDESLHHTEKSEAVERFQNGDYLELLVRASAADHLNSILEKGCYSQEYLPFTQGVQWNFMSGFLNSLQIEGSSEQIIEEVANNDELIGFGGENPCIIIMAPSKATNDLTSPHQIDYTMMEEKHGLTLVGVPSTEIAALLIQNLDSIVKTKKSLIEQEKYIPIYDSSGNLVFSESEYQDALNLKKFQTSDQYLMNPPINDLKEQSDGHGHGNLLDHTQRVMANTGKYKLNSEHVKLTKIAASLHDIGKNSDELGEQSIKNIDIAVPILNEIRGLSIADKQLIVKAISLDEKIGSIIRDFTVDSDSSQIEESKESLLHLFENEEELLFSLDLYLADVLGIGSGEEAGDWQVEAKLIKLNLHYTNMDVKFN